MQYLTHWANKKEKKKGNGSRDVFMYNSEQPRVGSQFWRASDLLGDLASYAKLSYAKARPASDNPDGNKRVGREQSVSVPKWRYPLGAH